MAPFDLLLQEHFRHLIRRECGGRIGRVMALDQGELYPLPDDGVSGWLRLGQAEAENLSSHILELAPLLHGAHLHRAQEIVGDVEGRFHGTNFPAFQLPVKLTFYAVRARPMPRIRSVKPFDTASIPLSA